MRGPFRTVEFRIALAFEQNAAVRQLGFMLSKFSAAGGASPGFREGGFSLAVRSVRGLAP